MENKSNICMQIATDELTEIISITEICRICANQEDKLVGIYNEDGENNDLYTKINLYLPIKVDKSDELPLQCCWQCTSTILAWHELFLTSIEADQRLRSYQIVPEKQLDIEESYLEQTEKEKGNTAELEVNEKGNNDSVMSERKNMHFDEDTGEYVTLQFPLQSIYEQQNKEELDVIEDLTLHKMEDDALLKKEIEEVCYGCQTCQILFISEDEMQNHILQTHPNQSILEKDDKTNLKKETKRNIKLDQEMVNAAKLVVDGKVYYNCKECGRCLYSPYTYIGHVRIHTGERPHSCHLCGKCFRVSQGLMRHLKETHEGIKNFPCDLCGRKFATKRNAEEHRRIHTNE